MEIEVTGSIKDVKQKMLLIRVIRPGIFTDISPPWARVIWTCIRGWVAGQSPPLALVAQTSRPSRFRLARTMV